MLHEHVQERYPVATSPPSDQPTAQLVPALLRTLHGDALKLFEMTYVPLTRQGMPALPSPYPPNLVSIG